MAGKSERCINEVLPHYKKFISENPQATNSQIVAALMGKIKNRFGKRYSYDTLQTTVADISKISSVKAVDNSHIVDEIRSQTTRNIAEKFVDLKESLDFESDFDFPESEHNPQRFYELHIPKDNYKVGLLYDIHIPYHHAKHLKVAVKHLKEWGADEILLMGDVVDFAGLSKYEKNWRQRDIDIDIDLAQTFLENLQKFMPNVKITWKEGNHEKRLEVYKNTHAQPFQKVKSLMFKEMLSLDKFGVNHVDSYTIIKIGKLFALHGHEIPGGGENVARNKMKRAMANIVVGHSHLDQEHLVKSLDGSFLGAWSISALCHTSPDWNPFNQWANGFGKVTVNMDGNFTVDKKKIINGEIR